MFYRVTYNVYVPVTFTHLVVRVHYILGLAKLNADVKCNFPLEKFEELLNITSAMIFLDKNRNKYFMDDLI